MTWEENCEKNAQDRITGKDNRVNKPISQYSKNGTFIRRFHSAEEASRITGVNRGNMCTAARGDTRKDGSKVLSAGGYKWKW